MTDEEMIALLRDYAKAYANGKPYNLNHGIILMVANRLEQLSKYAEEYKEHYDREN